MQFNFYKMSFAISVDEIHDNQRRGYQTPAIVYNL